MDVTNTAPRIIHLPGTKDGKYRPQMLVPGLNQVDDDYWSAIREHRLVKRQLEGVGDQPPVLREGVVKVPETPKAPISTPVTAPAPAKTATAKKQSEKGTKSPLLEMAEADALEVIENEEDLDRLQDYLIGETRKDVKSALAARIKLVKTAK